MVRLTHKELAEDLADYLDTIFTEVSLGSVWLSRVKKSRNIKSLPVQRADVIVVKPSYNKFRLTIYEVKATRSDFLSDIRTGKWKGYLDHCHRFYFAIQEGIASKNEIPKQAGLLVRDKKGWTVLKRAKSAIDEIPRETLLSLVFTKNFNRNKL